MSEQESTQAIDTQKLETVAREELVSLWSDLHEARRHAYEGEWSMKCDHLVSRIKALTPLVGPTPWEQIQIPLLEAGVYQRVHAELGIDAPEVRPDMARVATLRAKLDQQAASVRRCPTS